MIRSLLIENLILIHHSHVIFDEHLNVFTGETGAGKSALLLALRLVAGERADRSIIGPFHSYAAVEAVVEIEGKSLIIRREIHPFSPQKIWIDQKFITLKELKEFFADRIEVIDPETPFRLKDREMQKEMLDQFGALEPFVKQMKSFWEQKLKRESLFVSLQEEVKIQQAQALRFEEKKELFDSLHLSLEEETKLEAELPLLLHAQTLLKTGQELLQSLPFDALRMASHKASVMGKIDSQLASMQERLGSVLCEINDIEETLSSYLSALDLDPQRLQIVEERLSQIGKAKRELGADLWKAREEIKLFEKTLAEKEDLLAQEQKNLSTLVREVDAFAENLKEQRAAAAQRLEKALTQEFASLNLPHAKIQIQVKNAPLSAKGKDEVEILFSANLGHPLAPLSDCASSGELARILLGLVIHSPKKKGTAILFDEIDSHIGGETARIVGEKLKALSENQQLFCITHLPQVAKWGHSHFSLYKTENQEIGSTSIAKLREEQRKTEYERMIGGTLQ